jgi:tRNA(Ile)-lysidine synthase TilS/MesJ
MSDLASKVEQSILERNLLQRGNFVLLAVSGGIDSMVLLELVFRRNIKYLTIPYI